MKKIFICIFCLLTTGVVSAQKNDSLVIRQFANDILVNSTAYENLRYLCKKIGPRLSGSDNALKAVYATAKMLKDAGADTVYLQRCRVPHWIRGKKEGGYVIISGKKEQLHLTALGNSEGSKGKAVTADVVEVKNMRELDSLGNNVRGKIVFFNIPMNPLYIRTFNAYSESGVGRRSGPSQAAKYGAVAVMVRSLASNVDTHPHTGATAYNDSFPKIPAVAISTYDAEMISNAVKNRSSIRASITTSCTLKDTVDSYNVIGEMRGSTLPQEIITAGGHLDSWDLAEGAHDDGTGVVQCIEIIRSLHASGMRPKRTVRAVMFMNEENGGGGAKAYFNAAVSNKEQHIFAIESDAGGFTPRGFSLDMTPEKRGKFNNWASLFYPYGVYEFTGGGGGSDIGPLKKAGAALAGVTPDSQRYFDLHHAETDVFEAVSKRELELGAINMTAFVWLVSEYGL